MNENPVAALRLFHFLPLENAKEKNKNPGKNAPGNERQGGRAEQVESLAPRRCLADVEIQAIGGALRPLD